MGLFRRAVDLRAYQILDEINLTLSEFNSQSAVLHMNRMTEDCTGIPNFVSWMRACKTEKARAGVLVKLMDNPQGMILFKMYHPTLRDARKALILMLANISRIAMSGKKSNKARREYVYSVQLYRDGCTELRRYSATKEEAKYANKRSRRRRVGKPLFQHNDPGDKLYVSDLGATYGEMERNFKKKIKPVVNKEKETTSTKFSKKFLNVVKGLDLDIEELTADEIEEIQALINKGVTNTESDDDVETLEYDPSKVNFTSIEFDVESGTYHQGNKTNPNPKRESHQEPVPTSTPPVKIPTQETTNTRPVADVSDMMIPDDEEPSDDSEGSSNWDRLTPAQRFQFIRNLKPENYDENIRLAQEAAAKEREEAVIAYRARKAKEEEDAAKAVEERRLKDEAELRAMEEDRIERHRLIQEEKVKREAEEEAKRIREENDRKREEEFRLMQEELKRLQEELRITREEKSMVQEDIVSENKSEEDVPEVINIMAEALSNYEDHEIIKVLDESIDKYHVNTSEDNKEESCTASGNVLDDDINITTDEYTEESTSEVKESLPIINDESHVFTPDVVANTDVVHDEPYEPEEESEDSISEEVNNLVDKAIEASGLDTDDKADVIDLGLDFEEEEPKFPNDYVSQHEKDVARGQVQVKAELTRLLREATEAEMETNDDWFTNPQVKSDYKATHSDTYRAYDPDVDDDFDYDDSDDYHDEDPGEPPTYSAEEEEAFRLERKHAEESLIRFNLLNGLYQRYTAEVTAPGEPTQWKEISGKPTIIDYIKYVADHGPDLEDYDINEWVTGVIDIYLKTEEHAALLTTGFKKLTKDYKRSEEDEAKYKPTGKPIRAVSSGTVPASVIKERYEEEQKKKNVEESNRQPRKAKVIRATTQAERERRIADSNRISIDSLNNVDDDEPVDILKGRTTKQYIMEEVTKVLNGIPSESCGLGSFDDLVTGVEALSNSDPNSDYFMPSDDVCEILKYFNEEAVTRQDSRKPYAEIIEEINTMTCSDIKDVNIVFNKAKAMIARVLSEAKCSAYQFYPVLIPSYVPGKRFILRFDLFIGPIEYRVNEDIIVELFNAAHKGISTILNVPMEEIILLPNILDWLSNDTLDDTLLKYNKEKNMSLPTTDVRHSMKLHVEHIMTGLQMIAIKLHKMHDLNFIHHYNKDRHTTHIHIVDNGVTPAEEYRKFTRDLDSYAEKETLVWRDIAVDESIVLPKIKVHVYPDAKKLKDVWKLCIDNSKHGQALYQWLEPYGLDICKEALEQIFIVMGENDEEKYAGCQSRSTWKYNEKTRKFDIGFDYSLNIYGRCSLPTDFHEEAPKQLINSLQDYLASTFYHIMSQVTNLFNIEYVTVDINLREAEPLE